MCDTSGGVKPPDQAALYSQAVNGTSSMTTAKALGGGNPTEEVRMRSFAEIMATEKQDRNILEIHLNRMSNTEPDSNVSSKAKALTYDDLGELIFDILLVDYSQCMGFNYTTGKYEVREIKFKPGVDLSPYIKSGIVFKGHEVFTTKQMNNLTKVTFRNVPFNIPDEEIIQLCKCYGSPLNNKVHYEKLFNSRNRGMMGSTRWVEMDLKTSMNNFYWLEGPLPGDKGSRVTVLHNGQEQQCSNCLKTGRSGCKAQGNGKVCVQMMTPRARMIDYMTELKKTRGYESLKSLYFQQYPSLQGEHESIMDDRPQGDDDENDSEVLPVNPIERKDARIAELEGSVAEIPVLKEAVVKAKTDLKNVLKTADVTGRRVKFARKVTEEWLKDCLPDASFFDVHSKVMISMMSSLYSFEVDSESDSLKPKEDFLKDIEEFIENHDQKELMKERLEFIKSSLIERVNETAKQRRHSVSSVGKGEGRKRHASGEIENQKSSLMRHNSNPSK